MTQAARSSASTAPAIDLAKLTAILAREMGIGSSAVFWATDAQGITALHRDHANIYNGALKAPELKAALQHMIATYAGVQTYVFKGKTRTVLYRSSTLTGWTYGFGASISKTIVPKLPARANPLTDREKDGIPAAS